MHEHNGWYGANQVMASFVTNTQVWTPRSIPGHLQHDAEMFASCRAEDDLSPALTAFRWSRAAVASRERRGHTNQVAIGAPWLYLRSQPLSRFGETTATYVGEPADDKPSGALVLAEHGIAGATAAPRIIAEAHDRFGDEVTFALSHRDAVTAPLLQAYAEEFVVDLGSIEPDPASSAAGYLPRLLHLMRTHRGIASTTARVELLYAAALEIPAVLLQSASADDHARLDATGPDLTELALHELGAEDLVTRDELTEMFEWSARHD